MTTKKGTEIATAGSRRSLIAKMAEERGVEAADFYSTVTETMFRGANKSQLMTLLLVADRYHLDVTTKEIFAFPDKGGGIVPVVSIDGWISLAHQHPQYDGEEFRYSDNLVVPDGGKRCPEWMEIVIYRKDTSHPTVIREYLEECYRKTAPWQSHTKRMLRHKTMIQGYRVAFGFSGIKDEDEAQRMVAADYPQPVAASGSSSASRAREALQATPPTSEASDAPEGPPEGVSAVVVDEATDVDFDEVTGEVIEGDSVDDYEIVGGTAFADVEEPAPAPAEPRATKQQVAAIKAAKRNNSWSDEGYELLLTEYGVTDPTELSREEALEFVRHLMAGEEAASQGEMSV